jgi:hypothetical protein
MTLLRQILLGLLLLAALVAYHLVTQHRIDAADARATTAEAAQRDLSGQLAAAKGSERIVTRYVDRVQIVHERGATLVQKVPVYVTAKSDAACSVPAGFVRLHDAAAAAGEVPDRPGAADATPSGLALSAVAGTVVDNYTSCHATAEQLTALQDWVRANSATGPPP